MASLKRLPIEKGILAVLQLVSENAYLSEKMNLILWGNHSEFGLEKMTVRMLEPSCEIQLDKTMQKVKEYPRALRNVWKKV